jgi:hypothetical protein
VKIGTSAAFVAAIPFAFCVVLPISSGNGDTMRPTLIPLLAAMALLSATLPVPLHAQDSATGEIAMADGGSGDAVTEVVDPMEPRDAAGLSLEDFQWVARPIIIFADTPADPRFREQLQLLAERPEPLIERDVVIIVDTDPSARSAIRTALRPRGFALVVMQKDGNVGFRRPSPRDVREIIRGIDNFQFRQEELRSGG